MMDGSESPAAEYYIGAVMLGCSAAVYFDMWEALFAVLGGSMLIAGLTTYVIIKWELCQKNRKDKN